eukprot:754250-Hanusia_phi.AAC.2
MSFAGTVATSSKSTQRDQISEAEWNDLGVITGRRRRRRRRGVAPLSCLRQHQGSDRPPGDDGRLQHGQGEDFSTRPACLRLSAMKVSSPACVSLFHGFEVSRH